MIGISTITNMHHGMIEVVAIGNQAFAHCGEMTSVIVPNSVTSIGSNIFADCIKLKTATLSKNLTSTGKHTFNSCSSLTTVALPTGIKCIDTNAFANCTGLKSITLPVSITKIEYQAFVNDTLLDNITIPDNVVTISNKAFSNCPEVRICGYADSYAETYAKNMNIPFVEMALTLNDVWGFENPSGNMQLKHFSKFLNPMYSVLAFGTDTGDGLCYGMVVSAVAISEHNSPPVSSMHYTSGEGVKVLHDVTVEDEVLCILDADDQNYIGVWVCDYIRYAYVYQRTPIAGVEERQNLNKLNSLYYGVRYSVEKNKDPIEIMIRGTYGKKDAGHELLAFGIAKDDSDMTEILVYDCNTPQRLQSLYLNKTAGLYTGWSYSPGYIDWGTGDKYAEISFSTISDDFIKDVFADKEDMKALLDYQNLISVKSNIKNAKSSDGVNHDLSNDKDFLEVKSNNVLLGSEAYISNDRKLYWAKDIGEMTFENDSKENEIIIANMTNMIKANIAPNAVLKINVGEKMEDSYAKIENLSANSQFTIGYTNCINDKLYETNISGLASDTVITEVSNSAIIVKGADELEVYTTADDVMLEKIQIDTNNDSVKIVQDNDGLMDVYADKNNDGIYEKKLQSVSVSINPYEDVVKTDWFYSATQYTYYKGLMTGMDATHFSPYAPLSRAQFALILYRIEGSPSYETDKSFKDITGDEWYGEAVLWAADKGIVTGYMDGNFGPADMITREQMAVMMYRYAKYLGENVNNSTEFSGFKDAASVSSFATEAMQWAVGEGVITGKENATMLDPQGNTARCEAAVIIQRFME